VQSGEGLSFVAKKINGHETDSIFSRYNINNEDDLADAARKLQNRKSIKIGTGLVPAKYEREKP
jgi:hypothetical protein